MWLRLFVGVLSFAAALQAVSQEGGVADREEVRRLIEVSGLLSAASQRFAEAGSERLLQKLKFASEDDQLRAKGVMYQESKAMFQEFARSPDGLLDRIVPVYQRHLTQREVRVLLEFYELDLSGKLASAGGSVSEELRRVAQEWMVPRRTEFEARLLKVLEREGVKVQVP